jgi:hypothetical protein
LGMEWPPRSTRRSRALHHGSPQPIGWCCSSRRSPAAGASLRSRRAARRTSTTSREVDHDGARRLRVGGAVVVRVVAPTARTLLAERSCTPVSTLSSLLTPGTLAGWVKAQAPPGLRSMRVTRQPAASSLAVPTAYVRPLAAVDAARSSLSSLPEWRADWIPHIDKPRQRVSRGRGLRRRHTPRRSDETSPDACKPGRSFAGEATEQT